VAEWIRVINSKRERLYHYYKRKKFSRVGIKRHLSFEQLGIVLGV
jgi:hypothetical protein